MKNLDFGVLGPALSIGSFGWDFRLLGTFLREVYGREVQKGRISAQVGGSKKGVLGVDTFGCFFDFF